MKIKKLVGTLSLVMIGVIFGAVLVSNFGWVNPGYAEVQIGSKDVPVKNIDAQTSAFNKSFIEVAKKVNPSIVQITVISTMSKDDDPHKGLDFFFPFRDDMPNKRQGGGSGVIISDEGFILTNNHVVENADEVTVALYDKRKFNAKVVGTDPATDLAVIKIDDAENIQPAYLGSSDNLQVGQWVMAIGNPLSFTSTVTAGIVSAKGRSLNIIQRREGFSVEDFIQTDAVINPGNSGGALVDLSGSVIGINTAIATNGMTSSYIGYGFAIPIDLAKAVAEDLIEYGEVKRGFIGITIKEVDNDLAKAVGLEKPTGIIIQDVLPEGAAANSEISAGDIILEVDGKKIDTPGELQSHVASKRAGEEVELLLYRDGDRFTETITLKSRDGDDEIEVASKDNEKEKKPDKKVNSMKYDDLGMTVKNLSSEMLEKYDTDYGIIISDVERYSKAFEQRLRRGSIILEVDRNKIESVSEFDEYLDKKRGSSVLLRVLDIDRSGNTMKRFVGLEIPE